MQTRKMNSANIESLELRMLNCSTCNDVLVSDTPVVTHSGCGSLQTDHDGLDPRLVPEESFDISDAGLTGHPFDVHSHQAHHLRHVVAGVGHVLQHPVAACQYNLSVYLVRKQQDSDGDLTSLPLHCNPSSLNDPSQTADDFRQVQLLHCSHS